MRHRSLVLPLSLVVGIALLGLFPHLIFSWSVGELRYLKGAFDEDTYLLRALRHAMREDRTVSTILVATFGAWVGPSRAALAYVLFDALCPALAFGLYYLAFRRWLGIGVYAALAALLAVFGQDLLSTGCQVVWGDVPAWWDYFHGHSPHFGTTFLTAFRSPEPQIGMVVGAALVAWGGRGRLALGFALGALAAGSYLFAILPALVFCAASFATGNRRAGVPLLGFVAGRLVLPWLLTPLPLPHILFHSRAYTLTPSLLLALAGLVATVRRRRLLPLLLLAAPLFFLNQQLVTNFRITLREVEINANYLLVVLGLVIWLGVRKGTKQKIASVATALVVLVLVAAQVRTYRSWIGLNVDALTVARQATSLDGKATLILDFEPTNAAHVKSFEPALTTLLDFNQIQPVGVEDLEGPDAAPQGREKFIESVFLQWRELGWTREDVEARLTAELEGKVSVFYLVFLFSINDVIPHYTDYLTSRGDWIRAQIPRLGREYAEWGKTPHEAPPLVIVSARTFPSCFRELPVRPAPGRIRFYRNECGS